MAGAVTPEGAEQLVAVVTEGDYRMLMRLERSWAVKRSGRGTCGSPPSYSQAYAGKRVDSQGTWLLDWGERKPGFPRVGA